MLLLEIGSPLLLFSLQIGKLRPTEASQVSPGLSKTLRPASFLLLLGTVPRCSVCVHEDVQVHVGWAEQAGPTPDCASGERVLTPCVLAGSELPVCASCGQRIYDGQYLQALNADWHADCFR